MEIYLVGGAVRDRALGLAVKERDWVVVGATPEALLKKGFKKVGRDFPVFLHPTTKEEYALARKERKITPGYAGFTCDFDVSVTLEEDLARRDLTINAIAMDAEGQWIDPYHGLRDIENRILRHVSPAFVEDPVRVLRVARFAARFAHLGFQIAEETRVLIYSMLKDHEFDALVPERVWLEWQKALTARDPEIFIRVLRQTGTLSRILPEIAALFGVPKMKVESEAITDVGESSLMRLRALSQHCEDPIIRFATCCLELGKIRTAPQHWPFHPEEVHEGVVALSQFAEWLKIPNAYHVLAELGVKWHAEMTRIAQLTSQEILIVLTQTDAWRRPERFGALLKLAETWHGNVLTTEHWDILRARTAELPVNFIAQHQGPGLREAIIAWRLEQIEQQLQFWEYYEK